MKNPFKKKHKRKTERQVVKGIKRLHQNIRESKFGGPAAVLPIMLLISILAGAAAAAIVFLAGQSMPAILGVGLGVALITGYLLIRDISKKEMAQGEAALQQAGQAAEDIVHDTTDGIKKALQHNKASKHKHADAMRKKYSRGNQRDQHTKQPTQRKIGFLDSLRMSKSKPDATSHSSSNITPNTK